MKRNERSPADIGLQPERTELAWRRTLLALTVTSLGSMRALYPLLGSSAVILGLAGFALATALAVTTRHRFARMHAWFNHRLYGAEPHQSSGWCGVVRVGVRICISIRIGFVACNPRDCSARHLTTRRGRGQDCLAVPVSRPLVGLLRRVGVAVETVNHAVGLIERVGRVVGQLAQVLLSLVALIVLVVAHAAIVFLHSASVLPVDSASSPATGARGNAATRTGTCPRSAARD